MWWLKVSRIYRIIAGRNYVRIGKEHEAIIERNLEANVSPELLDAGFRRIWKKGVGNNHPIDVLEERYLGEGMYELIGSVVTHRNVSLEVPVDVDGVKRPEDVNFLEISEALIHHQ